MSTFVMYTYLYSAKGTQPAKHIISTQYTVKYKWYFTENGVLLCLAQLLCHMANRASKTNKL